MNDWDWSGAEKEFTTAIELSPKYATARHWYSIFLARQGRMEESYHQIETAYQIDPLAPVILLNMALGNDRVKDDYKSSVSFIQKALELDASFYPAYHSLARIQLRRGMYGEAIQNLQKAIELSSGSSEVLSSQGYCLGMMGRKADALGIVHELEARYTRSAGAAYSIARVYAGMDDRDKALEWLHRDFNDHSGWIAWILYDFEFDKLHDDARFKDLVHRVRLELN
jgi:tetratricopeptide (TPR) repeat protein